MNFSYRNYVQRYKYEPYCWPPDLGLSELHARCSQPGPINKDGVQCPCCGNWSKKKVKSWWKRDINNDFQESGTAIPGYFQLLKYYSFFAVLTMFISSIYPIYATYYTCQKIDVDEKHCLLVGVVYYLQFTEMIGLLNENGNERMVKVLLNIHTIVFYVLLFANFFSIIFITYLNSSARRQFSQLQKQQSSRCLIFSNISRKDLSNLQSILNNESIYTISIIKSVELYEIKKYYEYFNKRNRIYYNLLSLEVVAENPLKCDKNNEQLQILHNMVIGEKQKFNQFSGKVAIILQNVQSREFIHQKYRIGYFIKWWYGFCCLLKEWNVYNFDQSSIAMSTYVLGLESDILWQNIGEKLGTRVATKIKSFAVAIIFMGISYLILKYPMFFVLRSNNKASDTVALSTFEKTLPGIISVAIVGINIYFRMYMSKVSEQRNPQDQLERSRFLLITCLTFHILLYLVLPTIFFLSDDKSSQPTISKTIKLYEIMQQARTFILLQVIFLLIDLYYRLWSGKKISSLSDQRVAFKNNQSMLHKIVECRDYPLEIRLEALFKIWSLVLFYSFFVPYVLFYIIVAFFIIYWAEKRNLYKHYIIKRKVSIKLQSSVLIYYVNFFCLYLCFIYCYTVFSHSTIKLTFAIIFTIVGVIINIIYWIIMNKGEQKNKENKEKNGLNINHEGPLLSKQHIVEKAEQFANKYKSFIQSVRNEVLDEQIAVYLTKWKEYQKQKEESKITEVIELEDFNLSHMQSQSVDVTSGQENQEEGKQIG